MNLHPLVVELAGHLKMTLVYGYDEVVSPRGIDSRVAVRQPLTAWFIRKGNVRVHLPDSGTSLLARANQWLLLPAAARRHVIEPGTRLLSIRFEMERPGGGIFFEPGAPILLRRAGSRGSGLEAAGENLIQATDALWHPSPGRIRYERPRTGMNATTRCLRALAWAQAMERWAENFLAQVSQRGWRLMEPGREPLPLQRAQACLEGHSLASPLRLTDLAAACDISVTHLKRLIQTAWGTTPQRYLDRRRLAEAQSRLADSRCPIKPIAYELGFSSPAHFSTWFRMATGMTPSAYRRLGSPFGI